MKPAKRGVDWVLFCAAFHRGFVYQLFAWNRRRKASILAYGIKNLCCKKCTDKFKIKYVKLFKRYFKPHVLTSEIVKNHDKQTPICSFFR